MKNTTRTVSGLLLILSLFLLANITACSKTGNLSDTYLEFSVDGESYKLDNVILDAIKLNKDNWFYLGLGQDILKTGSLQSVPSAAIQWRVQLKHIQDLQGKEIDLGDVNNKKLAAAVNFTLTSDVRVTPMKGSEIRIVIKSVDDNFVEGSFEGKNLPYISMTRDILKNVSVSGKFRALIKK